MTVKRSPPLVFLKLGGSLLSDKSNPRSFRRTTVRRLGKEIKRGIETGKMRLLLAHGGGGAAHYPAKRYRTREGLPGGGGWRGFAETRRGVLEMNCRLLDALADVGLFPVLVPPSAGVLCENGRIKKWDVGAIKALLDGGQIPLVHGDAVLDRKLGFTIVGTEELFEFLAPRLRPVRIVLVCDVKGVYLARLENSSPPRIATTVTPSNITEVMRGIRRFSKRNTSKAWDVTGGMPAKVEGLFKLILRVPSLEARIVSGLKAGVVEAALSGGGVGTTITGSSVGLK